MFSDTIADMLTRIRNGYIAHKKLVNVPHSKVKLAIAKVLKQHGYLKEVRTIDKNNNKKELAINLLYSNNQPAITKVRRVSKSGRRIYRGSKKLPYVLSGLGIAILSTSEGIMTQNEARKKNIGGEIICEVW